MNDKLAQTSSFLRRIWRRWPREFLLRDGRIPVELLHVEERPEGRRYLVRLPDGAQRAVTEDELTSRLRYRPLAYAVFAAVLFAGLALGYGAAEWQLAFATLEDVCRIVSAPPLPPPG